MHFDDRLATVLRNPAGSETIARAQFRQLLDLLGTLPSDAQSEMVDAAYLRLGELAAAIPASERAAILEEPVLRLRSLRLVAQLALAEPSVASAAMARAELGEEQWLDLIPALPVSARGVVRHRRGLPRSVEALLARLGVADRGLPPADAFELGEVFELAETPAEALPETPAVTEYEEAPPQIDEIGAIVRRIEAFRKTRELAGLDAAGEDAQQALSMHLGPARTVSAFDFATDAEGRIVWAEPGIAPAAIGLRLAARDADSPVQSSSELLAAFRHRQPIGRAALTVVGAPAVAGEWRIDAAPRFDQPGGRFVGYIGRLRRPVAGGLPVERDSQADRMRQVLHELRTPVNAIQGFAEVIQQQLFGPTPHEYRALAATIASDSARMLAGFEELERLVKLDSGAMALDPGECDLLPILAGTIAQLQSFNAPRRSALELECDEPALPVALDQAEAERLVWRLLATLAGATSPGETLRLRARLRDAGEGDTEDRAPQDHGYVRIVLRLPASLAFTDGDALFDTGAIAQPPALAAGMFGTGFALRLAAAEAKAAGGALERRQKNLRLTLPGTDLADLPPLVADSAETGLR
ncbi:sensor histidine kinase [Novosphingobium sp. G106]|uniref:histidine kinase dimerization/phospho-acceptor domain-containing protein n=1 Tax=Novosphingobium sp. G106 TaxID=2849500 RepID=UPI001C2DB960|nr:histidine kinase dimerization/phospho-acceptor domain-containing protein [Novosphingobium sp. G106]MBV1687692.1 sensor histidine kinase [Novosphingobium sp. G106]